MQTNALMNTIDHSHLELLVKAKAITGANIIGDPHEGWMLEIEYGKNREILIAKRGSARVFKKFETLALYLSGFGLNKYKVDSTGFRFGNEPSHSAPQNKKVVEISAEHVVA